MKYVFLSQGIYYVLSGLWPLVHIQSFLAVTGPKTDIWLVKTVGVLVTVIGLVLISAGARRKGDVEFFVLGILAAICLAFIDLFYVFQGIISQVYCWDALVEFVLAALLSFHLYKRAHPEDEKQLPLP